MVREMPIVCRQYFVNVLYQCVNHSGIPYTSSNTSNEYSSLLSSLLVIPCKLAYKPISQTWQMLSWRLAHATGAFWSRIRPEEGERIFLQSLRQRCIAGAHARRMSQRTDGNSWYRLTCLTSNTCNTNWLMFSSAVTARSIHSKLRSAFISYNPIALLNVL